MMKVAWNEKDSQFKVKLFELDKANLLYSHASSWRQAKAYFIIILLYIFSHFWTLWLSVHFGPWQPARLMKHPRPNDSHRQRVFFQTCGFYLIILNISSFARTYTKHQTHAQSSIHTRYPFLMSLHLLQKGWISLTLTLLQRKRTFSPRHYS